jgi:hypothetical protein
MSCALLPPHRTGRAVFPHPALLQALASGIHKSYKYTSPSFRICRYSVLPCGIWNGRWLRPLRW